MAQQLFRIVNVALDGTFAPTWTMNDRTNLAIIQAKGDNDLDISLSPSGAPYFRLKAGRTLDLASFNAQGAGIGPVVFYFRGTAGDNVDIFRQLQP